MAFDVISNVIEGEPGLSITVSAVLLVLVMYISRQPAHEIILSITRGIRNTLRLLARSIMSAEKAVRAKNREVLLARGKENAERFIEREFHRVAVQVNRDLSGYPSLQRDLKDQITRIDDDYVGSSEVPPQPPEWLKAVEAVASIPDNGSPVVAKILNDIHITLKKSLEVDLQEYRRANRDRHGLLKKMMPHWRSLRDSLDSVEKKISGLEQRTVILDGQIDEYEEIQNHTNHAERMLSESHLSQFFISAIVLSLAFVGMYVNFQLVAMPMEEVVGASSYLGTSAISASDVAAMFIISIEVILGLFLMESAGVTRLFPVINQLENHKRKTIFWLVLTFLFILAGLEASLAYMRDVLVADKTALSQLLSGTSVNTVEVVEPPLYWIPAVGQMAMGFILPLVLTFVAIPLELFIHSFRTVGGQLVVWLLQLVVSVIRFLANAVYGMGRVLVKVYDLVIVIPIKIESAIKPKPGKKKSKKLKPILLKDQKGLDQKGPDKEQPKGQDEQEQPKLMKDL